MTIRPATAADVPFMIGLERQCASAAHWTQDQYHQLFLPDGAGLQRLVLVVDRPLPADRVRGEELRLGGLIGFLVARRLDPEWELENIVVSFDARRKGVGTRLLDALLSGARETKSESVFLEVRESNAAARKLYERAGFKQIGRRKSYYAEPVEDAVLYRHSLG